ncbi:MAG TPA: hypothetical protein VFZ16_15545 [Hyphomicrobiaceae bacterium]|nr:hypothetical protein [Hyphomicrobiaceae bacterium]
MEVADRLTELLKEEKDTRAPAARTHYGAPCLLVDGIAVEIPERLSLWKAIRAGPRPLRLLTEPQFGPFQSQVVDAIVEANAPYGRCVALGLCPTEWDDVSSNLRKAISAFLSRVHALARQTGATPDQVELWHTVWNQRPVPRFKTLEEFRSSSIGRALAHGGPVDLEPPIYDPREAEDADDQAEMPVADQPISPEEIDELEREGVIEAYDRYFLRALAMRQPLEKIAKSQQTRRRFGDHAIPAAYIAELSARVRRRRE